MNVYLVRDGILDLGCICKNGIQIKNTNFYLITYNFKSNEGYIDKKNTNTWRLYTQIGQVPNESRYHHFDTLDKCLNKLKDLNGKDDIIICDSTDVENYKNKLIFNNH